MKYRTFQDVFCNATVHPFRPRLFVHLAAGAATLARLTAGAATLARLTAGAATRSRTLDLLITSELLYLLSYGGQNGSGIL